MQAYLYNLNRFLGNLALAKVKDKQAELAQIKTYMDTEYNQFFSYRREIWDWSQENDVFLATYTKWKVPRITYYPRNENLDDFIPVGFKFKEFKVIETPDWICFVGQNKGTVQLDLILDKFNNEAANELRYLTNKAANLECLKEQGMEINKYLSEINPEHIVPFTKQLENYEQVLFNTDMVSFFF